MNSARLPDATCGQEGYPERAEALSPTASTLSTILGSVEPVLYSLASGSSGSSASRNVAIMLKKSPLRRAAAGSFPQLELPNPIGAKKLHQKIRLCTRAGAR